MLDMCSTESKATTTGLTSLGEASHTGPQALHCCYEVYTAPESGHSHDACLCKLRGELRLRNSNRVAMFFAVTSFLQAAVLVFLLLR